MASFDAVLFDFGGTLDADGTRWSLRFHSAYRSAGGTLDPQAFEPYFHASDRALAADPALGTAGFADTARRQARLLVGLLPDGDRMDVSALAHGFITRSVDIVNRNRPLLERLAARARLGVLSNYGGNLVPCLRELGLAHLFQVMLDSTVEGVSKPAPEFFRLGLERLNVRPERCWMVGDNPEADIRPALELGMRACWLTERARPTPSGLEGAARITRLPELEGVLA